MAKYTKAQVEESRALLLSVLKPGDTLHTILDHVSKSGMSRDIRLIHLKDGAPSYLTYHAARVLGYPIKGDAIRIGGCGMDMGFALVYALSSALFPRIEGVRQSGGYALSQRWL